MKHIIFVAIFFVVFVVTKVLVLSHHRKHCGCNEYDKFVLFSIPNAVAFMIAFIVAAVVQLTLYP